MIKNHLIRLIFINTRIFRFFEGLFCFLLFSSVALTTTAQDFEVAPVKMFYDCEPGEVQTKTMTVRNHANEKQQFVLVAADMKLDSVKKPDDKANNSKSCKDWMTINPSFFDLNPNETKEIKVIMQVPPGETTTRGAMIYVSSTEEQNALAADNQMKSAIKVRPRIGVKVVQSPKSNKNYKGAITNLKEITLPKDTARTFQVKISNTGDKMLDGKIYLVLSNLETAKEFKQKPLKISLFPGISKNMTLSLPKDIPAGKYSLAAILDYGKNTSLEAVQMNIEVQ
jgi:hypothetical protein